MKSLPLRELLRHPANVKRLTNAGQSVLITDNVKPLWVVGPAATSTLQDHQPLDVDDDLDAMLSEPVSPTLETL
jgi:hypothetical protein